MSLRHVGADEITRSVAKPAIKRLCRMDTAEASVSGTASVNMNSGVEFGNVAASQALTSLRRVHP